MRIRNLAPYVGAAIILCAGLGLRPAGAAEAEFHLGVVAAVTGPFAAPTADTFDGLNAWIKVHGLPGRKIVLDTLDDETNPVNAANLFRRLASDPKTGLIFVNTNSSSALAIKSFASEYKVPIISGGAADALGFPADPWMFKVAPSSLDLMTAVSIFAQKKGYKRFAHLYSQDAIGQYDYKNMHTLAPKYGLTIVTSESFAIDDTNFNAQLTRIRAANPDVIYSSATGRAAILIFKQFKQIGLTTPFVVSQAAVSKAFFDAIDGPAAANGLLSPNQLGAFGTKMGGDTARLYLELEKALGRLPVYFNTFGYDTGLILGAAMAHSDGSRQGLRDAMEKLKDLPAISGPVTYSPDNHTGQDFRSIAIGRLENGVSVPVE